MSVPTDKIITLPREQVLKIIDGINFAIEKLAKKLPFDNSSVHTRLILRPYAKSLKYIADKQDLSNKSDFEPRQP